MAACGSHDTSTQPGGTPAAATHLGFAVQPATSPVTGPLSPAVQVSLLDASGNTVRSASAVVSLSLSGGASGATLGGTTSVTAVDGVATFANVTVGAIGAGYQLQASAAGLTAAASDTFSIVPGPPAKLAFSTLPASMTSGKPAAVAVTLDDADGNLVATPTPVSLALATGTGAPGASLGGTITATSTGGVATFGGVTLDKAATGYELVATAGPLSATSAPLAVLAGAASRLAIRTQPVGATIGSPLATQPVIEIHDAAGNLVTTAGDTVTAAIATGGGTLSGAASVASISGVATFTTLAVAGTAGARSLSFSAHGLTGDTSAAFTMTPPPTPLIVLSAPSAAFSIVAGSSPASQTITISDGGVAPFTSVAAGTPSYDAGQSTGWLSASVTGGPPAYTLTLSVSSAGLVAGTYHATVAITAPGASNSPASLDVTLTVIPFTRIAYGTSTQRVSVVDLGGKVTPTITAVDVNGQPTNPWPVTFASRSTGIAAVSASGTITAAGPGETWVVATGRTSSDSVFIIVPLSASSPVLRTDLTSYEVTAGNAIVLNVILDARTTVGAARLSVGWSAWPNVFSGAAYVAEGPPTPVISNPLYGVLLVSIGSATGMNGPVQVLQLRFSTFLNKGVLGWITLSVLDASSVDGSSIVSQMTSTRYPIILR